MENLDEEPRPGQFFEAGFDSFIANLARIFVHLGNAHAVAVLSEGGAHARYIGNTIWNGSGDEIYDVWLNVPQAVFNSVLDLDAA
jgi:hypothetical protein